MQTFLPSKNFDTVANMLDSKRLNKQILECYQVLKVLSSKDPHAGWRNHPAVKMWSGSEHILFVYTLSMLAEADLRGIKTDKNKANIEMLRSNYTKEWGTKMPDWYQDELTMNKIIMTHRANLYTKDPFFYSQFEYAIDHEDNTPCCETCKYYWATHITRKTSLNAA